MDNLPGEVKDRRKDEHSVVNEEILDAEGFETAIAVGEHDKCRPPQADPAGVGLEVAGVW